MEKWFGYKKFLIIDLDAHQGNGIAIDHMVNSKYYVLDAYNHSILPQDNAAKRGINDDVYVDFYHSDEEYLEIVNESILKAYEKFKPDFCIYVAGSDILADDKYGDMNISR